ncbi:MAG: thiamine phosphate synthase [Planctomycetota bacterium]|nr:thiamine phosphate synthase [Planctomycetota bacterium]MDA1141584.1 thiamine phosphate synthase [Planctomycetota bacterium]
MFDLYAITDRKLSHRPLKDVVREVIAAGGSRVAVQLREKDMTAREIHEAGEQLLAICHDHGSQLFINDRIDVAVALGADGVQLTANSLSPATARVCSDKLRLGVSIHGLEEVAKVVNQTADFYVLGPVYFTESKAGLGEPIGTDVLAQTCAVSTKPVVAIGGLNPENLGSAIRAGAAAVAVISAIFAAPSPGRAVEDLLNALDRARCDLPPCLASGAQQIRLPD